MEFKAYALDIMTKKLTGITLLEAMLALAIATTIILFAIKNYSHYKQDRDAFALKYNVDMLFQAMRNYYSANCASLTLAPASNPANPFKINNITTTLTSYFDSAWYPANPLINSSLGDSGYAVQFNQVTPPVTRNENFCYSPPGSPASLSCNSLPDNSAILYLWIAQVVVKVNDTAMTLALKGLTGADCALTTYTAYSTVDCSTGVSSGTPAYLVWQRVPSFASPSMSSGLWSAMPAVKEFNLQYTNDPLGALNSSSAGSLYYLCGG